MSQYDDAWVAQEQAKRAYMDAHSLYKLDDEHASCGVGLVVAISGKPSRKVVENGINALKAIWHRGAVDADGKTGDGAGIHVQIPVPFFYDQVVRTGHTPDPDKLIAVGQVFLPRTDLARKSAAVRLLKPKFCGWAITSMAGVMCLLMCRFWGIRRTPPAPRLNKS